MEKSHLRTPLAKAKGMGSAKEGTGHFIHQRVTAIALVPLTIWFVFSIISFVVSDDSSKLAAWLYSGFNAGATIFMLIALFYHAKLGLQVVIEDYVHVEIVKVLALAAMKLGCVFGALLGIVSVLKLSFGM